ncbi:MAG: hypothetical protein AzoDbin1_04625 [Azoarcus sp.]|nr:hypothetical protein [Azoarcus sp.]
MKKSVIPSGVQPLARRVQGLSGTAHEDLTTWPKPDEGGLGERAARYLDRKRAVKRYLEGASDAELKRCFSLSLKRVYYLITNRLSADPVRRQRLVGARKRLAHVLS